MKQTKPILEWFEEARAAGHEWADAAIENAHQAGCANARAKNAAIALSNAFVWRRTVQGHDFWEKIYESLGSKP